MNLLVQPLLLDEEPIFVQVHGAMRAGLSQQPFVHWYT